MQIGETERQGRGRGRTMGNRHKLKKEPPNDGTFSKITSIPFMRHLYQAKDEREGYQTSRALDVIGGAGACICRCEPRGRQVDKYSSWL